MAASSRDAKASNKLEVVDIKTRRSVTEKVLGTTIDSEALPPLLVIPVLLFLAGLLDTLFSNVLQLSPPPAPILVISGLISLFSVFILVAFLTFAIVDGSINPAKSPFQTTLVHIIHFHFYPAPKSLSLAARCRVLKRFQSLRLPIAVLREISTSSDQESELNASEPLPNAKIYHEVIQATHDDDTLNQASAALFEVMRHSIHPVVQGYPPRKGPLTDEELATILRLLSPEATARSSRTAAQVIIRMHSEYCERPFPLYHLHHPDISSLRCVLFPSSD
ncbi:hypothetical protein B0H10DRAFT_2046229 [Mycena sp. CBHHK59/15]|nr:hypothetical protein B0H10DRAFT_2046229 [Mycena sp. CBHHK59/15]